MPVRVRRLFFLVWMHDLYMTNKVFMRIFSLLFSNMINNEIETMEDDIFDGSESDEMRL